MNMNDSEPTGNAFRIESSSTGGERPIRSVLLTACATALGVVLTVTLPLAAHDRDHHGEIDRPPVPANIEVPAGNKAVLVGHAVGTQNYVCLPSGPGIAWTLFTPQATLFTDRGRQLQTHFFSPNAFENGTVRAAWQDSRDASAVWGRATASSSDPNFVAPNAIPWLRIEVVGTQEGPRGGDELTETTFIQRLNTTGGVAPASGCSQSTDIGNRAYVPYTADYFFFEERVHRGGDSR
jgi:hypothetical protein